MVAVILATWEMEIGRTSILGQPGKKSRRPPSQPIKACIVVYTCPPCYTGIVRRRIMMQVSLGINARPYLNNNQSKKG
jgi:hypothetical protein